MIFTELIVNIAASAILLFFGFLFGKFRERKMQGGKNLDDYEFYPFDLDEKKNLFFVGIDVIGQHLTEINVTSPTGLQELERFENKNYAQTIWEGIEKKWKSEQ